jgi:transcriptional regulator with XRE-family HTH domain
VRQTELAELSGMNEGYISQIVSGERSTSLKGLGRIAAALRIDARDLLRRPELGPDWVSLEGLDPKQRRIAIDLIKNLREPE